MDINLDCIYCTIKKADSLFSQHETDKQKKLKFMKEVFKIISLSLEGDTAPYLSARIMRQLNSALGLGDIYCELKREYNMLLVSMEEEILSSINGSGDVLLTAMKFAMIGNFIDFGAMDSVDVRELKKLISNAPEQIVDNKTYKRFVGELACAKRMAYIADNAGEIVFDKIFIRIIKEIYPNLALDVIVRGKPVHNDATITDAVEIGLCNIVNVTGNGTDIPGTQLNEINAESREIIDRADLILAKGQGNFETLCGCGENIYYLFLCKCDLFTKRFNMGKFEGVFVNEKNVRDLVEAPSCP